MDLIFAYLAGLLTLINPCVLPVLPIVLASGLQTDRRAPLLLAAGMSLSFVVLGVGVAALGPGLGISPDHVTTAAAAAMILFGLFMIVPVLGQRFAVASSGVAIRADAGFAALEGAGRWGTFLGGALLGAVWSPCIGPTLGAAIALASTGDRLGHASAIMLAFALGVSTLIVLFGTLARGWVRRNSARLRTVAAVAKPVLGATLVLVGLGLLLRLNHAADTWLIQTLPAWLVDLSVSI